MLLWWCLLGARAWAVPGPPGPARSRACEDPVAATGTVLLQDQSLHDGTLVVLAGPSASLPADAGWWLLGGGLLLVGAWLLRRPRPRLAAAVGILVLAGAARAAFEVTSDAAGGYTLASPGGGPLAPGVYRASYVHPGYQSAVRYFTAGCTEGGAALDLETVTLLRDAPTPTPTPRPLPSVGYRLLRDWDDLPRPRAGAVRLYSSHSPREEKNDDYDHYLGQLAGNTWIMVDHHGPGVLTRLWMTARTGSPPRDKPGFNPGARLRVYVDGASQPLLDEAPASFFAGHRWPFVQPLVGQHQEPAGSPWPDGKGFYSYVPISFASSLLVTITDPLPAGASYPEDRLFYHAQVLDLTGQGPVEASPVRQPDGSLALTAADQAAYAEVVERWTDPAAFVEGMTQAAQKLEFSVGAAGRTTVAQLEGPGIVRGMKFKLSTGLSGGSLDKLALRVTYDGEAAPAMRVPFGTGWGQYFVRGAFVSLAQGVTDDGTFYLRLPMPFRRSIQVELEWSGAGSLPVSGQVDYDLTAVEPDTRYLHGSFQAATIGSGERFVLAEATGKGHLVGGQLVLDVQADPQALEGDEFITVDGQADFKGTGLEDHYNAHWFFEGGLRAHPLHGLTSQGQRLLPEIQTYRFLIADAIPFTSGFLWELENANVPGQSDRYRAAIFYYRAH